VKCGVLFLPLHIAMLNDCVKRMKFHIPPLGVCLCKRASRLYRERVDFCLDLSEMDGRGVSEFRELPETG
jgi:hypothetical protein